MTNQQNRWTREELILTLSVYFQLPFGRLNRTKPEVRELARLIGRSDNSAALRLVNFAACDPYITESGRTGMPAGMSVTPNYKIDADALYCFYKDVNIR